MTRIGIIAEVHMRTEHATDLVNELNWIADHFEHNFEPDHVFLLGDIIQHGKTREEDITNVERVMSALSDCSFPITYLLGNHDVINLTRDELADILDQDSFFGEVNVEDETFVYLDSSLRGTKTPSGMVGPDQLSFAKKSLTKHANPFVLVHHPIGNFDLSDNYWFAEFPEQAYLCDRKKLLDIMSKSGNIQSTITGHIHKHEYTTFKDLPHLSISAFSKETPNKPLTGAYAQLTVEESSTAEIKVRDQTIAQYRI
ncbi:metallophosphoesterase [Streptomyces sanglieri]